MFFVCSRPWGMWRQSWRMLTGRQQPAALAQPQTSSLLVRHLSAIHSLLLNPSCATYQPWPNKLAGCWMTADKALNDACLCSLLCLRGAGGQAAAAGDLRPGGLQREAGLAAHGPDGGRAGVATQRAAGDAGAEPLAAPARNLFCCRRLLPGALCHIRIFTLSTLHCLSRMNRPIQSAQAYSQGDGTKLSLQQPAISLAAAGYFQVRCFTFPGRFSWTSWLTLHTQRTILHPRLQHVVKGWHRVLAAVTECLLCFQQLPCRRSSSPRTFQLRADMHCLHPRTLHPVNACVLCMSASSPAVCACKRTCCCGRCASWIP